MRKISSMLLIYAYAISIFSQGILTPIYAFFVQEIGGGILEASWATALFSIVTGILTILICQTEWSHLYRKECLFLGWLLWLISTLMYCCISTVQVLFLSQILSALGSALSVPAYDAEYSELYVDDLTGGWGIFEGITSIFSGIAAIVGGFIVVSYGFKSLIICMNLSALFSFFLIYRYCYDSSKNTDNSKNNNKN